ncbi:hypothetical protein ABPG72_012102 [Tetrahymena utriculariae]
MSNYAGTGFTLNNVRKNMFDDGLNIVENKQVKKEDISREQLIQQVYGKNESELNDLELMGIDAFYKDQDRDDSELQRQAKEDYELQQNNYLEFLWKRGKQGWDKDAPAFILEKTKEIFIEKPLDYIVNNPVSI